MHRARRGRESLRDFRPLVHEYGYDTEQEHQWRRDHGKTAMRRSSVHLFVDLVLFLGVLAMLVTGLLLAYVLPPRSHGASVWGLTRHEWGDVHFYIAAVTLAAMVLHLILNWGWVCVVASKVLHRRSAPGPAQRQVAGVVLVCVLLALILGIVGAAGMSRQPDPSDEADMEIHGDHGDAGGAGHGPRRGGGFGRRRGQGRDDAADRGP